jgi:hypothetical protein
MSRATIYMPLLNEGTDVWRPVEAEVFPDGRYKVLGSVPDDEEWAFAPGSVVRGVTKVLSDGHQAIVAAPISN